MDVTYKEIIKFINTKVVFSSKDIYKHFAPMKINSTQMSCLLFNLGATGCIDKAERSTLLKKHTLLKVVPEDLMRNYYTPQACVINVVTGNLSGIICSKEGKVVISFNKKTIPETKKIFHSREVANEYVLKIKPKLNKNLVYNVIPL